ncbi:hypothetical protein EDB92DRAFT_450936 [Lactarius akahatsu]|uniref:Uncharacterized protein n=1 Tax=Lactarius akahatsu TaxID=416441 RepID=A0AAD4Q7N5_9AGAM|nr:hypothetical protein EDB92DRAFT_450936 [Lactarius akahatsu]
MVMNEEVDSQRPFSETVMLKNLRQRFRQRPTDSDPMTNTQAATSRTLYYAQQGPSLIPSAGKPLPSYAKSGGIASCPAPDTSAARYWAARAVTAEVLLTERSKHAHELRGVIHKEDAKRKEEIAVLHGAHEAHQRKMEWMVIGCIAVLAVVVLCLLVTRASPPTPTASHFTIPVLSPFTSVVEHETSAWGARIIVPGLMIAATLAWGIIRHWLSHKSLSRMAAIPS